MSLQANRKTREGANDPDRDAQFHFINDAGRTAIAENQPVISADTKKKLVGNFKNTGGNGCLRVIPKRFACMTF